MWVAETPLPEKKSTTFVARRPSVHQEELCTCYHRQQHEMRTSGDATRAGDKRQVAEEQQVTENSVYCIMF
ncbi:hypothetical protein ZWY2020_015812 [Hordeum vulgare]|nr:hypothetical protein ZWY2020_015812 [Hordeum vulgare]